MFILIFNLESEDSALGIFTLLTHPIIDNKTNNTDIIVPPYGSINMSNPPVIVPSKIARNVLPSIRHCLQ